MEENALLKQQELVVRLTLVVLQPTSTADVAKITEKDFARQTPPSARTNIPCVFILKYPLIRAGIFTTNKSQLPGGGAEEIAPRVARQTRHTGHFIGLHEYIFGVGLYHKFSGPKDISFLNDA